MEGFGEENYFILDFASLRSTLIFFTVQESLQGISARVMYV
jgi:hypothetical protein